MSLSGACPVQVLFYITVKCFALYCYSNHSCYSGKHSTVSTSLESLNHSYRAPNGAWNSATHPPTQTNKQTYKDISQKQSNSNNIFWSDSVDIKEGPEKGASGWVSCSQIPAATTIFADSSQLLVIVLVWDGDEMGYIIGCHHFLLLSN